MMRIVIEDGIITEEDVTLQEFFLGAVRGERNLQDDKWGVQIHSGHTWCSILGEEFGEFCQAVNDENYFEAEKELIQIAAVACAAWEQQASETRNLEPEWGVCKQTPKEVKND